MASKHVPLALRLKTKDTFFGRLQNIRFIATGIIATVFRYYWDGPEVPSWDLRFHVIRNILRQYLTDSLPHDMPNEQASRIDFGFVADYIAMNNLPSRPLQPAAGFNREHDIVLDSQCCVAYNVPHYGLSSKKLEAMAAADMQAAQLGRPRSISCQVLLSSQTTRFAKHAANVDELLAMAPLDPDERVILHFHGGAYCVGERSLTHIHIYAQISRTTGLRVFSPNYRLAPRHCFPSQLHDCFSVYSYMIHCGFKPKNIVLAGDSAGGALAVGVMFLLRDMKLPRPAAVVLISPWVDATCSGESWTRNQGLDYLPALSLDDPFHPTRMFYDAGREFSEQMLNELRCPLVSPIFSTNFSGMPPMLIQMGRNELLHDDIQLFADSIKQHNPGGAKLSLEVYDNMPHVFVLFDFADAAQQAFCSIGRFICANT
ncbi:hypothetical protein H4S02_002779 [Coemansia sp. RSA 2611]|nr:hypothetical protein H4S01_002763 [Coemansia sp. RSA 2610]KAJ2388610.1 hypothetical protein H4S02_002779 [Coemansia sp. RSA 2611]